MSMTELLTMIGIENVTKAVTSLLIDGKRKISERGEEN